jgi:hypothetical protein
VKAKVSIALFLMIGAWLYVHAQTKPRSFVALPAQSYTLQPGSTGRYQIISAVIDDVNNGPPHQGSNDAAIADRTVVRLDTQTGQTWILRNLGDVETGTPALAWVPLRESAIGKN